MTIEQYLDAIYQMETVRETQKQISVAISTQIEKLRSEKRTLSNEISRLRSVIPVPSAEGPKVFPFLSLVIFALEFYFIFIISRSFGDASIIAKICMAVFAAGSLYVLIPATKLLSAGKPSSENSDDAALKYKSEKLLKTEQLIQTYEKLLRFSKNLVLQAESLLNVYYSGGPVDPMSRHFVPVSVFIDYLGSGRCTSLTDCYSLFFEHAHEGLIFSDFEEIDEEENEQILRRKLKNMPSMRKALADISNTCSELSSILYSDPFETSSDISNNLKLNLVFNETAAEIRRYRDASSQVTTCF